MHLLRTTALALAAALGAAALAAPSVAYPGEDLPILAAGGEGDQGWAAVRVRTDGAQGAISIWNENVDPPGHVGAYAFADDGAYRGGSQIIILAGMGEAVVHVDPPAGEELRVETKTAHSGYWGGRVNLYFCETGCDGPREYLYLLVAAGDATRWRWQVQGASGVTLAAIETGDAMAAMTGADFDGGAHASASVIGAGARAEAARSKTLVAEERPHVVFFSASVTGRSVMTESDGSAEPRLCPCTFAGDGPGTHTFEILAGAGAGPVNFEDVYLGWTDFRLPANP